MLNFINIRLQQLDNDKCNCISKFNNSKSARKHAQILKDHQGTSAKGYKFAIWNNNNRLLNKLQRSRLQINKT